MVGHTSSYPRSITLGGGTVVHTPRVPEDNVPSLCLYFLPSTSSVKEPLFLLFGEVVRVSPCPSLGWLLVFVSLEKLVV